jgi:hypothetical protein
LQLIFDVHETAIKVRCGAPSRRVAATIDSAANNA